MRRIRSGDNVIIIAGKHKGKVGEVARVLLEKDRVVVSGVTLVKRHQKQSQNVDGGIIDKEASIHISNVSHIDSKHNKPTRIGFKFVDDKKVRFYKKSGEVIVK